MNIGKSINDVVFSCHEAARAAGWWKSAPDGGLVIDVPQKLMLIVSEVSEAMEGDRRDLMDDKLPHRKMMEVELADALIRICDLAGAKRYDLGGAVEEKMAYNRTRADHSAAARVAPGGKAY